jgi:molybdopterin/thiamine biosynthesis adenylyltransferase
VLVDYDRVEQRNLRRQNFFREELGQFKSEVLARRLAQRYSRPVAYSTIPVAMVDIKLPGLVIGCVDNGLARRDIAEGVKHKLFSRFNHISWWVDAGNERNYGQVIIGNAERGLFDSEEGICHALPLPTLQMPELLQQTPKQRSCADMEEQGPTINQIMAAHMIEVVHRIIEGTCSWMQLYLDLEEGTLHPVQAMPQTGERLIKSKKERR